MRISSNFDYIHGSLDQIATVMGFEYELVDSSEELFIKNRGVNVVVAGEVVGVMGIVHPWTLGKFDIGYPITLLELNIQKIKKFETEFII